MILLRHWRFLIASLLLAITFPACTAAYDVTTEDDRQTHGPVISPSVDEVVLREGQNFTFYCNGNGNVKFIQQEVPEEVLGDFKKVTEILPSNHTYDTALHLYNVDVYAVGYYACFDDTINNTDFLIDLKEEPHNTKHITYTYVYVNGTDTLIAPMREVIIVARSNSEVVIGCRPTSPDIKVSLTMEYTADGEYEIYSPKVGFLLNSDDLMDLSTFFSCRFERQNVHQSKEIFVHKWLEVMLPQPVIDGGSEYFLEGETFSLNCTVSYQRNTPVMLTWVYPPSADNDTINTKTNEREAIDGGKLYKNLTISKASKDHNGTYVCRSENASEKKSAIFTKTFLEKGFITMYKTNGDRTLENFQGKIQKFAVTIQSYPPATTVFLKDGKELPNDPSKYSVKYNSPATYTTLSVRHCFVNDSGNYTFRATNKYVEESVTYDFRVIATPVIRNVVPSGKYFTLGSTGSLRCDVDGYPMPNVTWTFVTDRGDIQPPTMGREKVTSLYEKTSILQMNKILFSGNVTCSATNRMGTDSATTELLVQEISGGFGIKEDVNNLWMAENDGLKLTCVGSKYEIKNVTWTFEGLDGNVVPNNYLEKYVKYSTNEYSRVAVLKINSTAANQSGKYTCLGTYNNGATEFKPVTVTVEESRGIEIMEPKTDEETVVYPYQPISLTCLADAVPKPNIQWFKGGDSLLNDSNVEVLVTDLNYTTVNSTVYIKQMHEENKGKYECVIEIPNAADVNARRFYNLNMKEKSAFKAAYLGIIGLIFFLLLVLVLYLIWKIRKEKQFRKELAAAGLLYWKEGVTGSINPDLMIDEQAELLPYDEKFEFPPEKLKLGKQLGAGAFGVVYKAEARGIVDAEESTTVAVKMVKKTADNMYIKALASELKIMVHLGKHINIVNLLGACTKNVGKRELIVIVEYCKFGCLHSYLQKHREVFIDQLTDSKEKTFGRVNKAFSSSSNNSANHSDYFGSNHTQATDNTFLNTANTNRSSRKVSESGYVLPEWRSNYESDYSYDGRSPRPLCSRDLLCWAFQIARGMEYLANRKVLHGDLAARNILLAEDNVVKICDFGLARSIYKNDEYQKKENSPLPVKWLAIECMTDRIFSTQSDIWSFGVVLWELFSLAKTPYPNISLQGLLQWLLAGNRLERPPYADDRIYSVMMRCWDQKPTIRPNFTELQEVLGSFLEDNVRNHYIDLNSPYSDINQAKRAEGVEDYLAMVCAPDYNNMITPSPHHYVNQVNSFFPNTPTVQLQHDDEGYLQMSPATNQTIFSPRAQDSKFDFDARKLNPRTETPELNTHSELTPMLTLNNLPARGGSESDQEGSSSPYLNMCPRIEEESDDVFEKQHNAKNNAHSIAVSNPVYITYDGGLDKKPQNLAGYVNVHAPNGLVK